MKNIVLLTIAFCLLCCTASQSLAAHQPRVHGIAMDSIPHAVSPKPDTTFYCIPTQIELRWTPGVSFTDSYYVEVAGDSAFTQILTSDVVIHDTTHFVHLPYADTTIYWRIRTDFDTTVLRRIILHLPVASSIVSPLADSIDVTNVKCTWHPVSGADRYELLFESDNYSVRDTVSAKDTTTTFKVLGNKSYTWKVRALCGGGAGLWSNEGHFTVVGSSDVYEQLSSDSSIRLSQDQNTLRLLAADDDALISCSLFSLRGERILQQQCADPLSTTVHLESLARGPVMLCVQSKKNVLRRVLILD